MLRIQEYLCCFDTIREGLNQLGEDLKIGNSTRIIFAKNTDFMHDKASDEVVVLNALLDSDPAEALVQEAHGLALYTSDLSIAYWAGMNPYILEAGTTWEHFSWRRTYAMEIPSGMTFMVYNHNGCWHVSDTTSPNGLSGVNYDLDKIEIYKAARIEFSRITDPWYKIFIGEERHCFVFQYVKKHDLLGSKNYPHVVLTNIIDRRTGEEKPATRLKDFFVKTGVPIPPICQVLGEKTKSMALKKLKPLSPALTFRKCNMRSTSITNPLVKQIRAAVKAGSGVSLNHVADIYKLLRNGDDLEIVASAYPQFSRILHMMDAAVKTAEVELNKLHEMSMRIERHRGYNVEVSSHDLSYILANYRRGVIPSIKYGLDNLPAESLTLVTYKQNKEEGMLKILKDMQKLNATGGSADG